MDSNIVNILCTTDDNYTPYCGIMLTSLFENNKDCQIHVYLMTEGLSSHNCSTLQQLAKKYNQTIHFITINDDKLKYCPIRAGDHVSIATYYRLLAPVLIPNNVKKVLYLDCDMIVNSGIEDLYNIDVNDTAVATVLDEDYMTPERYLRLEYPNEKRYFNAGMLLINMEHWRKNLIMQRCFDYIKKNSKCLKFHDQDTLNAILHKERKLLSIRYNLQTGFLYVRNKYEQKIQDEILDGIKSPVIIHYTGPNKPWFKDSRHPYRKRFLYYKSISLWKNDPLVNNKSFKEKFLHIINSIIWAAGIKKRPRTYIIETQD